MNEPNPATRAIREALTGRVSEETLEAVLAQPELATPRWVEVSVMCVDLRGFRAARRIFRDPEVVLSGLGRLYFDPAINTMLAHGATLDRVVDDQILAFFGAPVPSEDSAARAVACADAVHTALAGMTSRLLAEAEVVVHGVACGIATGRAMAGLVAHGPMPAWTLIGEVSTRAVALEDVADAGQTLMDAPTRRAIDGVRETAPEGPLVVAGLQDPVDVFLLT